MTSNNGNDILHKFHYTPYANGTLSNGSHCWLAFWPYHPRIDINGTVTNGVVCASPIDEINRHAKLGMAFAAVFVASVFFSLLNLRKHARMHLPREKRWPVASRYLVWCWLVVVAVCGVFSGVMSIDVDRDYIPGVAFMLQGFFYYLMLPPLLAAVWESVRHWACWQERQIYDRNPASLPLASSREAQERRLPVLFYTFAWLNFFLAVPRNWRPLQFQSSPELQETIAKPAATDYRFRSAAFMALGALVVIYYSLGHSIYHYRLASTIGGSRQGTTMMIFRAIPLKFILIISVLTVKVVQTLASSYAWSISPFNYNVQLGWMFGFGYLPVLLIVLLFNVFGLVEPNEDRALMLLRWEQRRRRRGRRTPVASRRLGLRTSSWGWKVPYVAYRDAVSEDEELHLELTERNEL